MNYYVYKVTHIETNEYYIGSRQCECNIEEDNYMGSMCTWKPDKTKLIKEIIKTGFTNRDTTQEYEAMVIEQHINNDLNRNYAIPRKFFNTTGRTSVKDSNGKTMLVDCNDPRILSGELVGHNKGRVPSEDECKQNSEVMSGRIWVNDGITSKMIYPKQLQEYIDNGFIKGRIKGHVKPYSYSPTKEQRDANSKRMSGRVWMTNATNSKMVKIEQVSEYINNGYKKGRK